jgi:uncharacterized protein involved in response to NO
LSYAWIPAGLALLALNAYGVVSAGASVHAFSVGTIGGMILAMVTRTALGHTGRLLVAGRAETAAYVLVHMAAGLRLMAAFASDTAYTRLIEASAALWCAAFLIYFATYLPRLLTSRVDAKPG